MSSVGAAIDRAVEAIRPGKRSPPNNPFLIALGTILMLAVASALLASLFNLWPHVEPRTTTAAAAAAAKQTAEPAPQTVRLFFAAVSVTVTPGTALLLMVMIVAALGSMIHAATSFADFVGNRRFYASWAVWYLLRLVVGVMLALLFYFALRGGLFSAESQSANVNPFGVAALAGLAGLFSKQATDKLREVFETLFRVSQAAGDGERKDDLANPVPVVTAVEPSELSAGATEVTLQVSGDHFLEHTSIVRINGAEQKPKFVSAHQLEVSVPSEMLAAPATLNVTVYNGPPGGGESKPPATLTIAAARVVG